MNLEEERDALRREVTGLQEMLGHILLSVGDEIVISKSQMKEGFENNVNIVIDDDVENDVFVFRLETVEDGQ